MKVCKTKTNENLTNCKLLLCIWILNKKTDRNSTNDFKFSNTHLNAGPIQQQICKNIDSLFVWMRSLCGFESLSLFTAQAINMWWGRPSLSISLSLHCSPISNMCMQRALSSSLAQHHSWSPLSPSSTSLIVIVIVIKLISSARTTKNAMTEMAKQISSMHSQTHTHIHAYIHTLTHTHT